MDVKITSRIYYLADTIIPCAVRRPVNLKQDASCRLVISVIDGSVFQNPEYIHGNRFPCRQICIILPVILSDIIEQIR